MVDQHLPSSVLGNIDAVIEIERRAERGGSWTFRTAHGFGNFVGSVTFLALHAAALAAWLALNSGYWPRLVFDPYPFALLGTLVSFESVILTTCVLIKQKREGDRASHRSHLDLQVNLLSEREITKVLQIVQRIADRVGTDRVQDGELDELLADTAVEKMAAELEGKAEVSPAR